MNFYETVNQAYRSILYSGVVCASCFFRASPATLPKTYPLLLCLGSYSLSYYHISLFSPAILPKIDSPPPIQRMICGTRLSSSITFFLAHSSSIQGRGRVAAGCLVEARRVGKARLSGLFACVRATCRAGDGCVGEARPSRMVGVTAPSRAHCAGMPGLAFASLTSFVVVL